MAEDSDSDESRDNKNGLEIRKVPSFIQPDEGMIGMIGDHRG